MSGQILVEKNYTPFKKKFCTQFNSKTKKNTYLVSFKLQAEPLSLQFQLFNFVILHAGLRILLLLIV